LASRLPPVPGLAYVNGGGDRRSAVAVPMAVLVAVAMAVIAYRRRGGL
jgi:hypothetical protein